MTVWGRLMPSQPVKQVLLMVLRAISSAAVCAMIWAYCLRRNISGSKVPQRFLTDKLLLLRSRVWSNISSRQDHRDYTQGRLTDEVKADMLRVCHRGRPTVESMIPCGNNSLRFGNAGVLYNAAEYLSGNEDKEIRDAADRLCGFLSAQEHIVCGTVVPDNCIETGILHGMPGVLYSICRYLRPDMIPSL